MRVSVCMAVYNGIRFIEEQLECIRKQTKAPDEVILCDDGSADGTGDFLRRYLDLHPDTAGWKLIFNEKNMGFPKNFYHAMSLCSGDVVFLADQDDIWDLKKIERMCSIMEKEPQIKVLACTIGLIDKNDGLIQTVMAPSPQRDSGEIHRISAAMVFYKCEWPGMALAYRNDWYCGEVVGKKDIGGREEKRDDADLSTDREAFLHIPHDFLICARAAEEHGFFQLQERLAFHRRHDSNAGGEEHRIFRLLKKERKQKEIADYNRILECFASGSIMQTEEGKAALEKKQKAMRGRYEALSSGRMYQVLKNAWKHKHEVRAATVICDLLIVKQK